MVAQQTIEPVRYGPDEACPPLVAAGVGLQGVALALAPTILVVAVTVRAAGQDEAYLIAATGDENLEDQLAYLNEDLRLPDADEISLRLLRHQAASVRHQKYYGVDIITVLVERTP